MLTLLKQLQLRLIKSRFVAVHLDNFAEYLVRKSLPTRDLHPPKEIPRQSYVHMALSMHELLSTHHMSISGVCSRGHPTWF